MSSRPFLKPETVITNGDMSSSITSSITTKNQVSAVNYSYVFTGTPTGTFSVEASDDYALDAGGGVANAGTWNTLPLTGTAAATGASGNGMIEVVTAAYAVRLVYTRTSGTGTLNAKITGMVL